MKKVVVINSTPRKGGNSEILAEKFAEGARAAGHSVEVITVRELELKFCVGCMYCHTHDKCALNDGMNALYETVQNADVLCFASPVYFYAVCGQRKIFLDRLNPLYTRKNSFKDVYLLAAAAENDGNAMNGSVCDIQGWVDCFEGATLKDVLRGIGVTDRGEINATDFPRLAFKMGTAV